MRLLLLAATLLLVPMPAALAQYVGPYAQPQYYRPAPQPYYTHQYPPGYGAPQAAEPEDDDESGEDDPPGYAYNGPDYREEAVTHLASLPRTQEEFAQNSSCYSGYTTLEIAAAAVTTMLESRGETPEGRRRVAYVIFHRGAHNQPYFGGTNLYNVVTKKAFNKRKGTWTYQFSPMENPRAHKWNAQDLENAKEAVLDVMCGRWKPPAQEACMLYFRTLEGHFTKKFPVSEVGNHRFYCEPHHVQYAGHR
jgi:hypothetical protein